MVYLWENFHHDSVINGVPTTPETLGIAGTPCNGRTIPSHGGYEAIT